MNRKTFTLCLTLLAVSAFSQAPAETDVVNSPTAATEELGAQALETEVVTIELADIETAVVQAELEIRYVSDEFFVPLRETPCPRCKIVHWALSLGPKLTSLK
jgi:hypothetical protein